MQEPAVSADGAREDQSTRRHTNSVTSKVNFLYLLHVLMNNITITNATSGIYISPPASIELVVCQKIHGAIYDDQGVCDPSRVKGDLVLTRLTCRLFKMVCHRPYNV